MWHYYYYKDTGIFTGKIINNSESTCIPIKTIEDSMSILSLENPIDVFSKQLDINKEPYELIEYIPPKPEDTNYRTYSWNTLTKRWDETKTTAYYWELIRERQHDLLVSSDWRVVKASETGIPISEEWKNYRQAIRDVTNQPDPSNIVWPIPPA